MDVLSLVLMIAAVIGVVVLILLFERRRAQEIERDLKRNRRDSSAPRDWERED
jgi:hypothetical protein